MAQDQRTKDEVFHEEAMPHLDALFGAAMKYTKSQRDAEDLVQDTLLKAYSNFEKYTPGTNCKAWLFRIQTNTFINRYRKKKRSKEYLVDDSDSRPLEERAEAKPRQELEPRNENHTQAAERLFGDEVNEALHGLPLDFRMVVLLADVHDFAYKECAEILECPIGTIMSRLYRGRRMLRAQLAEYAVDEGVVRDISDSHMDQLEEDRGTKVSLRAVNQGNS